MTSTVFGIGILILCMLGLIFVFALTKWWMDQRERARAERVRLLEEALRNPALDRATIESLAFQLTGARNPRDLGIKRFLPLVLAGGWLTLFTGIGVWVYGELVNDRDGIAGGVVTSIIGFGLVTYPFALRELEARRASQ